MMHVIIDGTIIWYVPWNMCAVLYLAISSLVVTLLSLRWRHNDHAGVSNHQPHGCLLNRLFRLKSKITSKLRVTGLCAGNSPGTGEFPAQMASYAENVSIWWRHHVICHPCSPGPLHCRQGKSVDYPHAREEQLWPLLLTWFNFNPSMDK